jgi:hypothetical protein
MSGDDNTEAHKSSLCRANNDYHDDNTACDLLDQAMTCDALCSLGNNHPAASDCAKSEDEMNCSNRKASLGSLSAGSIKGCCAKQLQLPMFLSSKCLLHCKYCVGHLFPSHGVMLNHCLATLLICYDYDMTINSSNRLIYFDIFCFNAWLKKRII